MNAKLKPKQNFTEGPLFFRITLFALPIMLTGILQICYSMADNIVVGQFSGDPNALAAVGSTSSLNNLIINLLLGTAAGTGVVCAQLYGAKENRLLERTVHTALAFSLFAGIAMSLVGILISKPMLSLMGTKPEILDKAVLYMRIICLGIPASSVYNFGASILRATGDSKRPLIILSSTGIVNVILNFFFVIACNMTVDGVALATIISQYLSAAIVVIVLIKKAPEPYAFSFKKLCFDTKLLLRVLRYGIPSGIQSAMFSISNMLLMSAVNTFPTTTVTANTISGNIDALAYTTMNSFSQAAMTFTGQNFGAAKPQRIKRVLGYSLLQVFVFGVAVGQLVRLFVTPLASLYIGSGDENYSVIIETVIEITDLVLTTYFLCGLMDVLAGFLRGMGYSFIPMITSLVCICGMRIVWVFCVFPLEGMNTPTGLFTSYPVTWSLAVLIFLGIVFFGAFKKIKGLKKD